MAAIDALLGTVLTPKTIIVGLTQDNTQVGNTAGGANTVLFSYNLPAGGLAVDGDSVEWEVAGTFVDTEVCTITIGVDEGGPTVIATLTTGGVDGVAANGWIARGRVVRTSATTQKCYGDIWVDSNIVSAFSALGYMATTMTLANVVGVFVKGAGATASNIKKQTAIVDFRGTAP